MRSKSFIFSILILSFFCFQGRTQVASLSGFGDPGTGGRDTAMLETLLNYAPQQLPGWQLEIKSANFIKSNYSAMIEGDAEIKGISTVKYRATYFSTDTLSSFQVNFPANSKVQPGGIFSSLKGNFSLNNFYLPSFFQNRIMLDSLDFRFPESGLPSSKSYYLGCKVLEDWVIFDQIDLKVSKIAMGFFAGPPADGSGKSIDMQGFLTGYIKWKDRAEISVTSNLTADIYDWVISLDARSFRISDIINVFRIEELTGLPVPTGFLDITLEKATLDIRPVKGIELLALTSLGNLNLVVERATPELKPMSTVDPRQKDYRKKGKNPTALQEEQEKNGTPSTKDPLNGSVVSKPVNDTAWINNPLNTGQDKAKWTHNPLYTPPANTVKEGNTWTYNPLYEAPVKDDKNTTDNNEDNKPKVTPATEAKGGKWGIMLGFSLPENFRFGNKIPALSFIDNFQLYNAAIYISSFAAAPQNSLPVHRNLGSGNPVLTKGLNLLYGYDLEQIQLSKKLGSLGDLTGINFICFTANIPVSADLSNFTLSGGINFNKNVNIGDRIYFPYTEFQLKPLMSTPEISLLQYMDIKLSKNQVLNFRGKAGVTATGTVKMAAALVNDWVNPFGFKGFTIGGLMLQAGIDFSTTPYPTPGDILITGHASLGDVSGKVILGIDPTEIAKNLLLINVDKLSWRNLVNTFCGEDIKKYLPTYLKPVFDSQLESARFKFVPPGAGNYTLSNEVYTPGFGVGASGNIAGWKGKFDIALEGFDNGLSAGLKATGEMDEIRISEGGNDLFRISGANNSGKPKFIVDLTTEKFLKVASGNRSSADTLAYINASVSLLGISNANAFINLTPQGYACKLNGKLFGMLETSLDAQIQDFAKPMENTYIKGRGVTTGIYRDAQRYLSKAVFDLKFSIDSIAVSGRLDGMKTGVKAFVYYRLGGTKQKFGISLTFGGAVDIAKLIFEEIEKVGQLAIAEIKRIAEAAIAGLRTTAASAVSFAKNTTQQALDAAGQLKNKLTNVAQTSYATVRDGIVSVGKKVGDFFIDFGKFSIQTVEKIYNKAIKEIKNGWESFTKAMKTAFTGADNEERIMTDGPAFRVITRYQGYVLSSPGVVAKNYPIQVRPRGASTVLQESWQLVPNDKSEEGSFYLVSGYNALLVTVPWTTHHILIPHESDHKDRERMLMESVPNEPGWYYLKFRNVNKDNTNYYIEVKSVSLPDIKGKPGFAVNTPQWVLAPVPYLPGRKPGEMGKFKFEKTGDIDWLNAKNLPPPMTPATPLTEGNRYSFNGQPEQYIFSNGSFRWIPDVETLTGGRYDQKPLVILPNNQQVSTVIGTAIPSRKDGIVLQATGDPAVYIMEGGKRRWIPDINTFNLMGLKPNMIQNVSSADLNSIPAGDQIPVNFNPKLVMQEKALYQVPGDPTVYVVLNKTFRAIPDPETLAYMGYNFGQIQSITATDFSSLPKGTGLATRRQNAMVQENGKPEVYMMDNGIRRLIPDPETLSGLGLSGNNVQKITTADMSLIPLGPAIASFK